MPVAWYGHVPVVAELQKLVVVRLVQLGTVVVVVVPSVPWVPQSVVVTAVVVVVSSSSDTELHVRYCLSWLWPANLCEKWSVG